MVDMLGGHPLQRALQRLRETTSVEPGPGCVPWPKRWSTLNAREF